MPTDANKHFTVVFEGDIRDLAGNPFKLETPWGKPARIAVGDVLEKFDELHELINGEPQS